jgi:Predicted hydrolase of the alpha/beta superfamily
MIPRFGMNLVAAACCIGLAAAASAAGELEQPVTIEGATEITFDSLIAGEAVRLQLFVPKAPAPETGYAVLYAFDGDASFATLSDIARTLNAAAARAGVAPVAVAAVTSADASDDRRIFDLTPAAETYIMPDRPNGKPWPKLGGGDAFLAMIETEVKPRLRARIRVDEAAETLFGHSLGGMMVLHRMATAPDSFDCYVASSPSLWVNDRKTIADLEALLAARPADAPPLDLHLSVGGAEEELGALDRFGDESDIARREAWLRGNAMVTNARALKERIEHTGAGKVALAYREYPGLNHLMARTAASIDAVRTALECRGRRGAGPN